MSTGGRPQALLLDHGGVVARSIKRPEGIGELARRLDLDLRAAGVPAPDEPRIAADILAGRKAYSAWKVAHSRAPEVPEISHRAFWADLVAGGWPAPARAYVTARATPLCRALIEATSIKRLGPGIRELLSWCREHGVRLGLVSNTLIGDVNRRLAIEWGTSELFAVQVHSDEVGVRKPDPRIITMATRALDITPAQAWFVGDNYDKDVLGARRAGIGCCVLMRAPEDRDPHAAWQPDLSVADGLELRDALAGADTCMTKGSR